jgi:hypothetical protein
MNFVNVPKFPLLWKWNLIYELVYHPNICGEGPLKTTRNTGELAVFTAEIWIWDQRIGRINHVREYGLNVP